VWLLAQENEDTIEKNGKDEKIGKACMPSVNNPTL
jgi:hypothetical protein